MVDAWTVDRARELYSIDHWGEGFVSVGPHGNLMISPTGEPDSGIDLKALVEEVRARGIKPPLLLRFPGILQTRLRRIHQAFARAIEEFEYPGRFQGVYPIKVNQDRYLVETIVSAGRTWDFGLEVGSKPELMAAMAMLDNPAALIICNGYKDWQYVELALRASQLGSRVIMVVERPEEVDLIRRVSKKVGIVPSIGVRAKLSTRGAGHWKTSAGDTSKFGLTCQQILEAVDRLREGGLLDRLMLLHFHLGSQISAVRTIKDGVQEAARMYVELVKLGVPLAYLDVGGGLGVDYDGSQTDFVASMDYTMQEYADNVVGGILEVCQEAGIERVPTITTESGRATVAHHALLVCNVLSTASRVAGPIDIAPSEDANRLVHDLYEILQDVDFKSMRNAFHDARHLKDQTLTLFKLGHLGIEERAQAESYFWSICRKIQKLLRRVKELPEEFENLERNLAATYFCNFSIFQSLPDTWAIDQIFPVLPIHRLDEEPTERAILADVTCDSDGRVDQFIDKRDVKQVLEVHPPNGDPYYLGFFLVGAYQEILGDLHNLFGDTNALHVIDDSEGHYQISHVDRGDRVSDVLSWVLYNDVELVARLRKQSEAAVRKKTLSLEQSRALFRLYDKLLGGYTYLDDRMKKKKPAPTTPTEVRSGA